MRAHWDKAPVVFYCRRPGLLQLRRNTTAAEHVVKSLPDCRFSAVAESASIG
jgi:hypothetical protein